ncbi:MAG: recombinase family protein, partial [Leadbetterella sp.]|nr:recombinase family protein [Leadbetterella sp.]
AEYERAQIAERSRRGKIYRAKQGSISVISKAPFGFDYIKKNQNEPARYEVNSQHSKTIKKIYSYYVHDRLSIGTICSTLSLEGLSPPKGGKIWHPSTIRDILRNPAYIGTAYFGKTEHSEGIKGRIYRVNGKKRDKAMVARKSRPNNEWIPVTVPKIIDEDIFTVANQLLDKNKETSSRNTREPSLLQGMIICGECGHPFYKKLRSVKPKKSTYYCCSNRLKGGNCKMVSCRQDLLDNSIWDELIELLKNPELLEHEITRRASESEEIVKSQRKRQEIERDILRINSAKDKLLDAYQEGECLLLDELKIRIKELNRQKGKLENELKSLEGSLVLFNRV